MTAIENSPGFWGITFSSSLFRVVELCLSSGTCVSYTGYTVYVHSFIHSAISIAPFKSSTTQRRSRLQHGYCIGVSRRSAQATVGKGLAQVHTWRLERESNPRPSG